MARILYGVHGTAYGHAIRALTIARHFPEHEFFFVSHNPGIEILRQEYPVLACPGVATVFRSHRVAVAATIWRNLRVWRQRQRLVGQVLDLIDGFRPDVALSDYDHLIPQASRLAGLPCLSLDHQHIITFCRHPVPLRQLASYAATSFAVRAFFSQASDFLVTSFFCPPLKPRVRGKLVAPILRDRVLARQPEQQEHVLVYQSYPAFKRFFPFLRAIPSQVRVYGGDTNHQEGNLHFRQRSEEGFLDDLASCRYVICGGSHNLISEALFYGKPVLSFPIKKAFEQFLNAYYLERLGYGRYVENFRPRRDLITAFEAQLANFQENIRHGQFLGNEEAFALVDRFIQQKSLRVLGPLRVP